LLRGVTLEGVTSASFRRLVAEVLDSLPPEFRERLDNVAVLVEDVPGEQRKKARKPAPRSAQPRELLMGVFVGTPATSRSVFALPSGPARIVLYQKNIEAVCHSDAEIRREVRLTVIHEIGHYFGMDEDQLRHV
jgi:predicted Zn-dependent protease with MMP-like domain